MFHCIFVSCIE